MEDRGASNIIGVILLVGMVVILGSTIGVYTSGLSSEVHDPALTNLEGSQTTLAGDNETSANVTFTLRSGEKLRTEELQVLIDGEPASQADATLKFSDSTLSVTDQIIITQNNATDLIGSEQISVIYSDSGSESATELGTWAVKTGGPSNQSENFTFEAYSPGSQPGDPWSTSTSGGDLRISDSESQQGSKSLYMSAGEGDSSTATLTVDLTYVETLRFQFKNKGGEGNDLKVYIDGTVVGKGNGGGWQTINIDVSEYTGTHTLKFQTYEDTNDAATSHYIDDIRFIHETGNLVPEELVIK